MGAKQSIFLEHKPFFVEFLDRRGEVGGFFNTKTGELKVTKKAKGLDIKALIEYPQSSGIIAWHTHPQSSEDRARKEGAKYPFAAMPSHIDALSALRTSVRYKEPTINAIISKAGIFMYKPSKSLLKLLLEYPETERENILNTIVLDNLAYVHGKVHDTPPKDQVKVFKKEMKGLLTGKDGGFETHFAQW
jgi:hypothetical protein